MTLFYCAKRNGNCTLILNAFFQILLELGEVQGKVVGHIVDGRGELSVDAETLKALHLPHLPFLHTQEMKVCGRFYCENLNF